MKYTTSLIVLMFLGLGSVYSKKKLSEVKTKSKSQTDAIFGEKIDWNSDEEGNSWYTGVDGDYHYYGTDGTSKYREYDDSYGWEMDSEGNKIETFKTEEGFEVHLSDGGILRETYGKIYAEDKKHHIIEGYFDSEGNSWGFDADKNYYQTLSNGTYIQCVDGKTACTVYDQDQFGNTIEVSDNGNIKFIAADGQTGWDFRKDLNNNDTWHKDENGTQYINSYGDTWFWSNDQQWYWAIDAQSGFKEEWWYDDDGNYFYQDSEGYKEYIYKSGNSYYYNVDESIQYFSADGGEYYYDPEAGSWSVWDDEEQGYAELDEPPEFEYD